MPLAGVVAALAAATARPAQGGTWDWIHYKTMLSLAIDVSDDVLHIWAGLLILTLAAAALRRPPWHIKPWLIVAVIELLNETYDLTQTAYETNEGNLPAAWHDFWMTMLWPTVILLLFGRLARRAQSPTDGGIG